jgi:hypothetical protein
LRIEIGPLTLAQMASRLARLRMTT